jgi:hypothetical protein
MQGELIFNVPSEQSPLLLSNKKKVIRNVANVKSITHVNGKNVKSKTTTKTTTGARTNVETVTVFELNNDKAVLIDLNSETIIETTKHGAKLKENDDENEEKEKEEANFPEYKD